MRHMKLRVVLSGLALSTLLGGSASAATHQLVATLDGAQEVPAVNTAATGSATLTYDDVTNKLTGTLTYQGVTATAIHIHEEKRGVNGGVALDIGALPSPIAIDLTVDEANEPALLAEGTYINIHSGNFVNGEIRGQITAPPAKPKKSRKNETAANMMAMPSPTNASCCSTRSRAALPQWRSRPNANEISTFSATVSVGKGRTN